jgi:hypothetical protein
MSAGTQPTTHRWPHLQWWKNSAAQVARDGLASSEIIALSTSAPQQLFAELGSSMQGLNEQ